MTKIQKQIINGLRREPLNHYLLAAQLHEPPFRVRAELKHLKRDRLVAELFTLDRRHVWQLTARGQLAATSTDQLELA